MLYRFYFAMASTDTFVEDDETPPSTVEKHIYRFDDPLLTESGFVQIFNKGQNLNRIVLHFPERSNQTDYLSENKLNSSLHLFVNKQLLFSFNYLPILTWTDFQRSQAMFYKAFIDISSGSFASTHRTQLNEDIVFGAEHSQFTLTCCENINSTVIEVNLEPGQEPNVFDHPCFFQLQLGNYTLFCSQKNLPGLSLYHQRYIVAFILQKIVRQ